ncbi:hypothetical protein HAX54_017808 [Datura stramonium]|uniref:Putative plant transposon protein domain-containing protein n=1 Tax=Datura stramonium TaxID=4076 RepID=A0ABS8UNJ3_DATST|nr:hypothetical protein [Datura stramonium]
MHDKVHDAAPFWHDAMCGQAARGIGTSAAWPSATRRAENAVNAAKRRSDHASRSAACSSKGALMPRCRARLLGTTHVDPQPFVNIVKKTPYRDIRHTLFVSNSVARWTLHKQFGYHVPFPYAHLSREARVWLKIICACLVPEKHVTHVIRERVCIVYALMIGMPINMGVIIKNVLNRERVKKGQNFGFGGLLTRFLSGHDIDEEEADYRPAYDTRGIDVTKTKEPKGINSPVFSVNERNAQIDNMLSLLYAPTLASSSRPSSPISYTSSPKPSNKSLMGPRIVERAVIAASRLRMNGMTEEQLQQLNMDYSEGILASPLQSWAWILEPFDDDVATKDKMTRVDSDIESSDDNEEDSEMGESDLAPTVNEE